MPRSMTGFGRGVRETPHGRLVVEVRAVNARFGDTRVRLPVDAPELELRLHDQIRAAIARGKADATVRLEPTPEAAPPTISAQALRRTFEELHRAVVGLPLAEGITLDALLRATPREDLTAEIWRVEDFQAELLAALAEALRALTEARATEGQRIAAFLADQLGKIESALTTLRQAAPQVVEQAGQRVRQRIEELERSQGLTADPGRLEQELVYLAQRLDVTEELDRLEVHCRALRDLLGSDEPVGRRMDFLIQEIQREVNTTGAKTKDSGITSLVVDLKVVIEQMREQVQNVE